MKTRHILIFLFLTANLLVSAYALLDGIDGGKSFTYILVYSLTSVTDIVLMTRAYLHFMRNPAKENS